MFSGLVGLCAQDKIEAGEALCVECRRKRAQRICNTCKDPYCERYDMAACRSLSIISVDPTLIQGPTNLDLDPNDNFNLNLTLIT